jgi:hypothetical protein
VKTCSGCGQSKVAEEFDRVRRGDEKRKSRCKDCIRTAKGHKRHPHAAAITKNRLLVPVGRKVCLVCGAEKKLEDFYNWTKGIGGRHPWCKACVLHKDRMKKYGMTWDEVEVAMAVTHCPGCLRELGTSGAERHFDHDHQTGTFRRVLCETCNVILGYAREDEATLLRLAELVRL